jgi:regulator of replication initiation timing
MFSDHTGHGCPEEQIENLLNERIAGGDLVMPPGPFLIRFKIGEGQDDEQPTVKKKKAPSRKKQLMRLQTQALELMAEELSEMRERCNTQAASIGALHQELTDANNRGAAVRAERNELRKQLGEAEERAGKLLAVVKQRDQQLEEAHALTDDLGVKLDEPRAELHDERQCTPGPLGCLRPSDHPKLAEQWAVPKCNMNRWEQVGFEAPAPADYCVSEHCARCNAYRREAGVPELSPNQWMTDLNAAQALALPETQGALAALGLSSGPPPGSDV